MKKVQLANGVCYTASKNKKLKFKHNNQTFSKIILKEEKDHLIEEVK